MSSRIGAILCEVVRGEIDVVESFLQAIETWYRSVSKEFEERAAKLQNTQQVSEYEWDAIGDEQWMSDRVRRAMFASVAVSLSGVAENFLLVLCVNSGIARVEIITEGGGEKKRIVPPEGEKERRKPGWEDYKRWIEKHTDAQFGRIPCYCAINRVRLLNNCFKHSDGTVSEDFKNAFGGNLGDEIRYESENWNELVSGCRTFLEGAVAAALHQKKCT